VPDKSLAIGPNGFIFTKEHPIDRGSMFALTAVSIIEGGERFPPGHFNFLFFINFNNL
jgi:hypothetical protein